jgi:hypothetical protein
MAMMFNIYELKIYIFEVVCGREDKWPFALTMSSRSSLARIARVSKGFSDHALNLLWRSAPLEAVCRLLPERGSPYVCWPLVASSNSISDLSQRTCLTLLMMCC